jgi:hypothetical protein
MLALRRQGGAKFEAKCHLAEQDDYREKES